MMGCAPLAPSHRAPNICTICAGSGKTPTPSTAGVCRRALARRAAEILTLDRQWRALETEAQESQAMRNRLSRDIGAAKGRGEPIDELLRQVEGRKEAEGATTVQAAELRQQIDALLASLPN